MLHLLSVITAAAALAMGIGFVGAEAAPQDPPPAPGSTDGPAAAPPRQDIPSFEGRSIDPDSEGAIILEEEEDVELPPED